MSKAKNKISVKFCGLNASDVTGSMTYIKGTSFEILLEAGLFQGETVKEVYKANSRKLPFKPKNLTYVFVGHAHIDHTGLIPRLVHMGFNGRIIAPIGTKELLKILWSDSAFLIDKEAKIISRKYKMNATPIYNASDVEVALNLIDEHPIGTKVTLNNGVEFQFRGSGHIINAAQIELWLKEGNSIKHIGYTSDLGNISIPQMYTTSFEPIEKCNLLIGECTYCGRTRTDTTRDRAKDIEKIKAIVDEVCIRNKSRLLIPVFALARAQTMLSVLYNIYGRDDKFNIKIVLDSPMAVNVSRLYSRLLDDANYEEILQWNNLVCVTDYEHSQELMNSREPLIILSSGGMLQGGRSVAWLKKLLSRRANHILFVGYSAEGTIGYKLKYAHHHKTINIDGKPYANRCGVTNLLSFSSHMQHDDLLFYYSNVCADKIVLVHGNANDKSMFVDELENCIARNNKTTQVCCPYNNLEITL